MIFSTFYNNEEVMFLIDMNNNRLDIICKIQLTPQQQNNYLQNIKYIFLS